MLRNKEDILDNKKHLNDNMQISNSQDSEIPPLVSRLKAVAAQNDAYFQFPGHNKAVDNLFAPKGPILDAQKQAAKLFGAEETWFLVGGSTCGIQASILATCSPGDTLIIQRNSHKSAFAGMVFSGAIPKYMVPEYDFDWDICHTPKIHLRSTIRLRA
ncbi:putative arginine decarboxylase [Helianthus anomalus]